MMLKCPRCGHVWLYKGNRKYNASCASCKTSVAIVKNTIVGESEEMLNYMYNILDDSISRQNRIIIAAGMRDNLDDKTKNLIISLK